MKATLALVVVAGLSAAALGAQTQTQTNVPSDIENRLNQSANVLMEMAAGPSGGITEPDLRTAQCIAVIPNLKQGALIVGARHGAGFASCRTASGWSAPAGVSLGGGSVGLQAGGQESDIVMALKSSAAKYQLLENGLKFGTNASAMAGSVGHVTQNPNTDVLVWSRSGGAFAGVNVNGATLKADDDANRALYGPGVTAQEIVNGQVRTPPAAAQYVQVLDRVTGMGR